LLVENGSGGRDSHTILFERRGEKVGYRIGGAVQKEAILDAPELTAQSMNWQRSRRKPRCSGLYQDEAHAMVEPGEALGSSRADCVVVHSPLQRRV